MVNGRSVLCTLPRDGRISRLLVKMSLNARFCVPLRQLSTKKETRKNNSIEEPYDFGNDLPLGHRPRWFPLGRCALMEHRPSVSRDGNRYNAASFLESR